MSDASNLADASDKSEGKISSVPNDEDITILSVPKESNPNETAESVTQDMEVPVKTATTTEEKPPSLADSTLLSKVPIDKSETEDSEKQINETEEKQNKNDTNEKTETISNITDDTESQDEDFVLKYDDDVDDMLDNPNEKSEPRNVSETISNIILSEDEIAKNYDNYVKKGNIAVPETNTNENVSEMTMEESDFDEKAVEVVENVSSVKAETLKSDDLQKIVEESAISDLKQTESVQLTTKQLDDHTAKEVHNKKESLAVTPENTQSDLKVESHIDSKNTDISEFIDDKCVSDIDMSLGESETSFTEPAEHGLNQPNNMIEIPTQELLDISDNLIDSSQEEPGVKEQYNDISDVVSTVDNNSSPVCIKGSSAMKIEDFIANNQEISGNFNESSLRIGDSEESSTIMDTEIPQNISTTDEMDKSEIMNQEMEVSVEKTLQLTAVSEKTDSISVPQHEEKMSVEDVIEETNPDLVSCPNHDSVNTDFQKQTANDDKFVHTAALRDSKEMCKDNDNQESSEQVISTATSTNAIPTDKSEIQEVQSEDISICNKTETKSSLEKEVKNMLTDIEESNEKVVSTVVAVDTKESKNQELNSDEKCKSQIKTAVEVKSVSNVIDDIAIENKVDTPTTQKESPIENTGITVIENKMEIETQGAKEITVSNSNKMDTEILEGDLVDTKSNNPIDNIDKNKTEIDTQGPEKICASNANKIDIKVLEGDDLVTTSEKSDLNIENKDLVAVETSKTSSPDKPVTSNVVIMEIDNTNTVEEFKLDSDQKQVIETNVVITTTTKENATNEQDNGNGVCSDEVGVKSDQNQCMETKEGDIITDEPTPSTSKDAIAMDAASESKTIDNVKDSGQSNEIIVDAALRVTDLCSADMDEGGEESTAVDMTDSLGLLAESSRVRDDADDDQDQDSDRDDYDDDFDQDDENSNQMVDQSEDSALNSETDIPRTKTVGTIDKDNDDAQDCPEEPLSVRLALDNDSALNEQVTFDVDLALNGEVAQIGAVTISDDAAVGVDGDTSVKISDVVGTSAEVQGDVCQVDASSDALDAGKQVIGDVKGDESLPKANDDQFSRLRRLLQQSDDLLSESLKEASEAANQSPSKLKRLAVAKATNYVNIVDLEDGSDDDTSKQSVQTDDNTYVSNVDISMDIEVSTSEDSKSGAGDSALVPKAKKQKTLKASKDAAAAGAGGGLEVFNLDSDDEDSTDKAKPSPAKGDASKNSVATTNNKCVNNSCTSDISAVTLEADGMTRGYYESSRRSVCRDCALIAAGRTQTLLEGIKNFTPLLELDMSRPGQQLVEILDSESDDEADTGDKVGQKIGQALADELQLKLAGMLNETWVKYNLDERLKRTEEQISMELNALELDSAEVQDMLAECQLATDRLRSELYATFESQRINLASLIIVDTPESMYSYVEPQTSKPPRQFEPKRRRLSGEKDEPAKKQAVSVAPIEQADSAKETKEADDTKMDDDKDVSVVKLCLESAPSSLPALGGVLTRPALRPNMQVFGMRNMYGLWHQARLVERVSAPQPPTSPFTMCRVRFDLRNGRSVTKVLPARCLAYYDPPDARITIGTRVIALFKDNKDKMVKRRAFYSGVIAEIPNPVNKYRYLVFFDDGYAQYVKHSDTRLVCEFSSLVWEEVHPFSREFVKEYLLSYPERPMVRLHTGQTIKTEWNGKWWVSKVLEVDASLVHVYFEQDKRTEWIYRGSTRLAPLYLERQNAGKIRNRPLPRNRITTGSDMPYVEYTRTDADGGEQTAVVVTSSDRTPTVDTQAKAQLQLESLRNQRAVAKKSTTLPAPMPHQPSPGNLDSVTSRVVYYTPKNAIRPHKMVPHNCGPHCKRTDVLALKDLRTYNPLAKPLLSGWERQIVRFKGCKEVMYRAPCGRRVRNMAELHRYLTLVQSDMPVDLFHFGVVTHCLAEFVLNKCIVGKKDLSHGKENVPVPCVNYYDDTLPEFCFYNTERTPTAGVPLNLDPDFLCGCDCTDDCEDKSKCACWQMTLEGARTIGLDGNVGYVYKRLPDPLPSGIYECNVRCKCRQTCLNRVAQHPLQLKLQVFKTLNRGWGIRALNDVPKGTFLCVYAGNLLTDATANLDGLNEGDEYLAELDYIEVVEQMKEGYEDDVPKHDKKLDKQDSGKSSEESEMSESESEDETRSRNQADDCDFEPGYIQPHVTHAFSKRLRKRKKKEETEELKKEKDRDSKQQDRDGNRDDDCITISDDEELREPASFAASADMGGQFISKYRSVRSHFGKDEACYIMDAKVQGNIGRYLNHSCCPNVFVQNVFVDTHDPRFPWVAFFALNHIKAGTELTWNYNYDIGSVPNKVLYCYCGAANCRGRLL